MNEKKFLPDYTRSERVRLLEDNCVHSEEMQYYKQLSEEEIAKRKDEEIQHSLKIRKLEQKKKEVNAQYKDQIKELRQNQYRLLDEVSTGLVETKEKVWLVDEQEQGLMVTYNADGDVVNKRPLMANERQLRISHNQKANNE